MDNERITTDETGSKNQISRSIFEIVELFVLSICVVFIAFMSLVKICTVSGDSMQKTLLHGQTLVISNLFYTPSQGDIIVFHQTSDTDLRFNEPIVKRVIATEGQFVKIDHENNAVYVSNDSDFDESEILKEEYAYIETGHMRDYFGVDKKVFEVPQGHVFVLGDNRNNSSDSRYPTIGFVDTRRILGKVLLRITPIDSFGTVN